MDISVKYCSALSMQWRAFGEVLNVARPLLFSAQRLIPKPNPNCPQGRSRHLGLGTCIPQFLEYIPAVQIASLFIKDSLPKFHFSTLQNPHRVEITFTPRLATLHPSTNRKLSTYQHSNPTTPDSNSFPSRLQAKMNEPRSLLKIFPHLHNPAL